RGECGRRRSGAGISAVIREWKKPESGGDRVTTNRHDAVSGGNSESGRQLVKHFPARVDQFFVSLDHTEINFGAVQLQGRLLAFVLGNFSNKLVPQGFSVAKVNADPDRLTVFTHNFAPCRCVAGEVKRVFVL